MNKFVTAIVLMLIAFSAMSQDTTAYAKIEKAYKDPQREMNSAKADVFIMGKRIHEEQKDAATSSNFHAIQNQSPAIINRKKK